MPVPSTYGFRNSRTSCFYGQLYIILWAKCNKPTNLVGLPIKIVFRVNGSGSISFFLIVTDLSMYGMCCSIMYDTTTRLPTHVLYTATNEV